MFVKKYGIYIILATIGLIPWSRANIVMCRQLFRYSTIQCFCKYYSIVFILPSSHSSVRFKVRLFLLEAAAAASWARLAAAKGSTINKTASFKSPPSARTHPTDVAIVAMLVNEDEWTFHLLQHR